MMEEAQAELDRIKAIEDYLESEVEVDFKVNEKTSTSKKKKK